MNIAFEISPLITASGTFGDKSGVYRYTYGLLKALIDHVKKDHPEDKIYLFTFNGSLLFYSLNPDVVELIDNKHVFLHGYTEKIIIPQKSESNLIELFSHPLIKLPLKALDKTFHIHKTIAQIRHNRGLMKYIKSIEKDFVKLGIDVVMHSETGFYPFTKLKNVIIVYDITTELLPSFHRIETCDLQNRKIRFAKKYCKGVITISENTKNDLRFFSKIFKEKKMVVVYPGLDESFKTPVKPLSEANAILPGHPLQKGKYCMYYGTFEPRKNIVYVVRSFAKLYNEGKIPADYKMLLIGGKGWGDIKEHVQMFIKENYPDPNNNPFIVLDYINDEYLKTFIQNAYMILYPSIYEGFGLPVLESMALGTPVLCSNTSSLPEAGGDAALYVNPKNFNEICDKLTYAIQNPAAMQELSEKGKTHAVTFSWKEAGEIVYKFFATL